MSTEEPMLRADIMAKADITRDVMTFLVRGGALRPIEAPTGTGFKLRFPWYEYRRGHELAPHSRGEDRGNAVNRLRRSRGHCILRRV